MPPDKKTAADAQPVTIPGFTPVATLVQATELMRLRSQLKGLEAVTTFRHQVTMGDTISKLFRENSVFQRMIEQQKAHERSIELLTRPLSESIAKHFAEVNATADIFRTIQARFSGMQATFAALENLPHLRAGFPEFALRGYTDLQQTGADFITTIDPPAPADTLVADRELSLAGAVAVAATEVDAPVVETRTLQIVESIDAVLTNQLGKLQPGLVEHWQGARDAMATANPNRVTYVYLSLRELAKGTVNALVHPEEATFQAWVKAQPSGKVSLDWKARFLFRNTQLPAGFTEADARWIIELFAHLNREGVHRDGAPAQSDAELRAILRRVEGWLASLIEVSQRPRS